MSSQSSIHTARKKLQWREQSLGYLFLAPSIAAFVVFLFYPLVRSVYLSTHLTDPRGRIAAYVGLDNFTQLLNSSSFWNSLGVTALFALLTVPAGLVLGLITAYLTHGKLRGMKIFQWIFSMPVVLSVSTASVIWMILYHPSVGMLNYLLGLAGLPGIQWLTDPSWALVSISLMTIWMNSGFNFIILMSGMQGISEEIMDSAKIDGASPIRTLISIMIPLVSPTLFFLTIVSLMHAFQAFGQIQLLTKGGPAESTQVLVYSIYKEAFINYQFGTGSALSLVLFVIILLLTAVQFLFVEKKVHYQ
nr:sugar ABC transporter permease [Paenibacillus algorifonticola]